MFLAFPAVGKVMPYKSPEDTVRVNGIIGLLRSGNSLSTGDKLVLAAEELLDAEYDDYYEADSVANLRINLETFSPLMFVNDVIALVLAAESPGMADWNTFAKNLENIACRRGENNGFPSLMYHTSDWIGDNISRGNVKELTENYSGVIPRTKSLDEMTRRRDHFAALKDSAVFENVRMTEMGFRTHRVPTLKKETIKNKDIVDDLENGDIIILVPNRDGIDCYDIGFVVKENGTPHFIHVSPSSKKVVKEKDEMSRYMSLVTKHFQGYRIIRLQ